MKARKLLNFCLATVIWLLVFSVVMTVLARVLSGRNSTNGSTQLERSSYPVKPFASVADALAIEDVAEWRYRSGSSYLIALPERLQPVSDTELVNYVDALGGPEDGVLMLALDQDRAVNGVNVILSQVRFTGTMTPDDYVTGVAGELRAAGYQVDDVSAYVLGGQRAGRLIYTQSTAQGETFMGVQFAIVNSGIAGDTVTVIVGTSRSEHFADWLPVFQLIAREHFD